MTSRFAAVLAFALVGASDVGAQLALRYDEAAERVTIYRGETAQAYQYDAARKGFAGADGGLVAWDDAAGCWQWRDAAGAVMARFDSAGRAMGAAAPVRASGYNPLSDVGDAAGSAPADLQPAWKYLETRDQTAPDAASPMSGDEGGSAAALGAVGGDAAGRDRTMREAWQATKGAHQGDPEGAMETGAPSDPLGKLRDTLKQAATAVRDVRRTKEEIENIGDELRGEDTGLFDGDDAGMGSPDDGSGAPPAGTGGAAAGGAGNAGDAGGGAGSRMAAPPEAVGIPSPIPDDGRMR